MKKNIWIIIVIVIVLIVILFAGLVFKKLNKKDENKINYNEETTILEDSDLDDIENKASNYIEDLSVVNVKEPIEKDSIYYNDVNSITDYEYNIESSYMDANLIQNGDIKYARLSDSRIIKRNFRKDILFDNDKVLIPTKLYLMDNSTPAYFKNQNNLYYIPIEKCETEDEERIVFKDYNIIIMRKSGNVSMFGKDIKINYSENIMPERFFDELFLRTPNSEFDSYKLYETDLDNNPNTIDISIGLLDYNEENGTFIRRIIVSKDENNIIKLYNVPNSLGGNIASFKNVFYSMYYTKGNFYNNYTNEYMPISYILFDKETGFREVYKYANGEDVKFGVEDESLAKYPLTLSRPLKFGEVPIDINSEVKYSTMYANLTSSSQITLDVGTKIIIVKIIDKYGNSIARLEDGTLIEIANYTGI